jgi:hypothetical protein
MTGKELERLLEHLTPLNARDLDARARELRKMRMVPSGGRGPNAPKYGLGDVATFLISIAGTDNATHAALAVMDYAPLVPSSGTYSGFVGAETFAEAITAIIAKPEIAEKVKKIRVCRSFPITEICFEQSGEEKRAFYVAEGNDDFPPQAVGSSTMTVWAEIGPALIKSIVLEMDSEEEGGWVGETEAT